MPLQRKIFRVEQLDPAPEAPAEQATAFDSDASLRHHEIIHEIRALRALVEPKDHPIGRLFEIYQAQIAEMHKLKSELDIIQNAITDTKQEIAAVHLTHFRGQEMSRVTHELDAVVAGTESATQRILNMAEDIDQFANNLFASANGEQEALARAIQDRVIQIFEACNFQDLTGQRITKVVNTWKFIETHLARMMEIWGGIDAFRDFIPEAPAPAEGDARLLNGPRLDGDIGHASQDDIDAMFK